MMREIINISCKLNEDVTSGTIDFKLDGTTEEIALGLTQVIAGLANHHEKVVQVAFIKAMNDFLEKEL